MGNKKQKSIKRVDRMRVIGRHADKWLQKENRLGTVKGRTNGGLFLCLEMDKPAKRDKWDHHGIRIRRGYCYLAFIDELEKIE